MIEVTCGSEMFQLDTQGLPEAPLSPDSIYSGVVSWVVELFFRPCVLQQVT